MEKKIFNSGIIFAFWANFSLFLFFLVFGISISAHSILPIDKGEISVECKNDSITSYTTPIENIKIYVLSGTIIYNAHKISNNVEIIQKENFVKKIVINTIKSKHSKSVPRLKASKVNSTEQKYISKIHFKQLPFESNTVFSKSRTDVVTVPSNNPQIKVFAVLESNKTIFFIPILEKYNSKFVLSLSDDILRWQMHIRPPPEIMNI